MRRRNRLVLGGSTMIIVSGVAMSTVTSCSNETPADQPAQSLESVVSRVVEASPNRDSTTYETPSRGTAAAVASNVAELLSTGGVGHPFDSYELQRVTVSDRAAGSGADADMSALVEGGDPTAGNGLYVVRNNPDVHSPMIVQIPHPVADQYTERMGTELFATTDMGRQRLALRRGISVAIFHAAGSPLSRRATAEMACVHARRGRAPVDPALYPYWIESLLKVVAEADPEADEALLARWRQAMEVVCRTFERHYEAA